MVGEHAGVEHRDDHADGWPVTRSQAASALIAEAPVAVGARRYHWPASGPRPDAGPRREQRVVGHTQRAPALVDHRRVHLGVGGQAAAPASVRVTPLAITTCERSLIAAPARSATPARAARRSARRCTVAAAALADWRTDSGLFTQQRRVVLQRDDDTRVGSGFAHRVGRAAGRGECRRGKQPTARRGARSSSQRAAQRGSGAHQRAITRTMSSTLFE